MSFKKNIVIIVVLLSLSSSVFSQKLKKERLFGSANIGSGPIYGLIGSSIEIGYFRYSLHFGAGMAQYMPFTFVGGVNSYFYPFKRVKSVRGRAGVHFGTIEHETSTALWPFFTGGFEYWFRNYFTFNVDLSFPFKKDYYVMMPSLGVGYNITAQLQQAGNKIEEKRKDSKSSKKKVPKPTF